MGSIDVIVPCYRYARFLRQCVESVITGTRREVRVLVIDDASPDDTAIVAAELAEQYSNVVVLCHAENKGNVGTYNSGIDWASAKYLCLLSADDYLLPGALDRAADLMDAYPEVGFTFGKAVLLYDGEPKLETTADLRNRAHLDIWPRDSAIRQFPYATASVNGYWRILTGLEFIEQSVSENLVPALTAVVRTEVQKRVGRYRPEIPSSCDMEMWLRIAATASVGFIDDCQAVYRKHEGNMSTAYVENFGLGDLQQKKGAIDCFFETCANVLPNADELKGRYYSALSRLAVARASAAFSEGRLALSDQLSDLAVSADVSARRSWPWAKLKIKRRIGYDTWRNLQPRIARFRKL